MKTFALCCVGFLAGTAAAFITQTPVLETLGYAPKKPAMMSSDLDVNAEENMTTEAGMENRMVKANDSNENKETPHTEFARTTPSQDFSKSAATVPTKIVNKHVKPKTATTKPKTKETVASTPKAPSTQTKPKEKSVVKKQFVVAKPPMRGIQPEIVVKKMPTMKAKPRVGTTQPMARTLTSARAMSVARAKSAAKARSTVKAKTKPTAKAKSAAKANSAAKAKPALIPKDLPKPPMELAKADAAKAKEVAKEADRTPMVKKTEPRKPSRLSGSWQVIKAVHGGRVLSTKQARAMTMKFVGEDIVIKYGKKRETGKFVVGKIASTNGSESADLEIKSSRKDMPSIKGFYTKKGDVVTMVWGAPGAERPDPNVREEIKAARTLTLKPSTDN